MAETAPASTVIRLREYGTKLWWLTGVCFVVAVVLVALSLGDEGPRITVRFERGHGLEPGNALRYRGLEVGRVGALKLTPEFDGVVVEVELAPEAAGLARRGSQFWIERPQVSLARVSGVDTVLGPKYLGVIPGPADAKPQAEFVGRETPPTLKEPASEEITIRFQEGHGLAAGDPLKYRGIAVGEVSTVRLAGDLSSVDVKVRLVESATRLARTGSRFWIERPRISLAEVRGLETVVGGRYLAVLPGPADAESRDFFEGLDEAPALTEIVEGGLEIVLEGAERSGLEPGSPVTYRGISVGQITSVGLSSDAVKVEARAYIQPPYRELIHDNTRFWSISGIEVSLGWTGVTMDMESFSTLAAGGVAMVTPDPPGRPVATGHRFVLWPEPLDSWRTWQPRIPIGNTLLPEGLGIPRPLRASLRWKERGYVGFSRARQLDGWVLPLEGGRLLGPFELLSPAVGAIGEQAVLAVAGQEFAVLKQSAVRIGPLGAFVLKENAPQIEHFWPLTRIRAAEAPEDCLLVGDPQSKIIPLSVGRLTPEESSWGVDASIPLDRTWHGASVVSRRDGAVIGILLFDAVRCRIQLLKPEELEP